MFQLIEGMFVQHREYIIKYKQSKTFKNCESLRGKPATYYFLQLPNFLIAIFLNLLKVILPKQISIFSGRNTEKDYKILQV